MAQRHDYKDWPEIDLVHTRLLPAPPEPRALAMWGQQISLSHLWDTQNAKRVQHTGEELRPCPLCLGPDCRSHFPLDCPGTSELCATYKSEIDHVRETFPHMVFLPVLYTHPEWNLLQTIHRARELPEPFDLLDFLDHVPACPTFYTDGSCMHPLFPVARLAAFSIVVDAALNDDDRCGLALAHRGMSTIPDTLVAVQVALAPGLQTVNRAEFSAVVQIIRSVDAAIVFSDSAWTMHVFRAVRDNPVPADHCRRGNFDLILELCRLAEVKDLWSFDLRKIKAHQTDDEVPQDLLLYNVMGNRRADELAGKGTEVTRSPVHVLAHKVADWFLVQRAALLAFRPFAASCDVMRLDGFDKKKVDEASKPKRLTTAQLDTWNPEGAYRDIPLAVQPEQLKAYMPGPSVLLCFLRWFSQLKWPYEDTTSGGISHYELMLNFVGVTKCPLPRILDRSVQRPEYKDPLRDPAAELLPLTVWDSVRLLEHTVTFAKKILGVEVFPLEFKAQKTFLWGYGCRKLLAGLTVRPVLLEPEAHAARMLSAIQDGQLRPLEPFSNTAPVWRSIIEEDSVPHAERVRLWRRLDGHGRKRK